MKDITFRRARPEDVDAVVALMYESSKNLMDYCFRFKGGNASSFLRYDFLKGRGLFGYLNQVVGVGADGEIIATVTVYPGAQYHQIALRTTFSAVIHFGVFHFFEFYKRSLAIKSLFILPKSDGLFMANGCIAKPYRGKGIFSCLLKYVLNLASSEDFKSIEFDVSFSNTQAQKIYEHLGFEVVDERSQSNGPIQDGFRRMERLLK